jgi:hypothetical protein
MRGLLVCIFVLVVAGPAHAQHLGFRQQWQPQTESDPRLRQPVEIEILGRAAVTGLPILSEKTGVSFSVAPEDLATVGERKFTVIAQGLELKSIMVQLCEALQECHWDVDASGPELTYWLHRNSGAEQLVASSLHNQSFREWQSGQERLRILEAAQRALQMSPEELDELEKTELVLARLVRFAPLRGMVEGLFSLPPDRIEELLSRGRVYVDYRDAPAPLREAAHLFSRYAVDSPVRFNEERPEREWPRSFRAWIVYDLGWGGIAFRLRVEETEASASGRQVSFEATSLPGPLGTGAGLPWQYLLLATGTPDLGTAYELLKECEARTDLERKQEEEEQEERRRAEILDPALQQIIDLDEEAGLTFSRIPQVVARETGLSVISDYFTPVHDSVPDEARQALPLWRPLDLVAEDSGYQWRKVGECLVFHHVRWYDMIAREIPERLIVAYRKKLDEQGQFTLEDVAAFAVALGREPEVNLPSDFQEAGLVPFPPSPVFSFFRVPMSSDHLAKARSADGLSFEEMTPAQQQQLRGILESRGSYWLAGFQNITLAVRESPYGSKEEGGTEVELELHLWRGPESVISTGDSFRLPRREKDDSSEAAAEERE